MGMFAIGTRSTSPPVTCTSASTRFHRSTAPVTSARTSSASVMSPQSANARPPAASIRATADSAPEALEW